MIENEKDLTCSKKHNQPIVQILINSLIPVSKRLLCATCIDELENQISCISFKKAMSIIKQKQEKRQESLNQSAKKIQNQLQQFKQQVDTVKSSIIQIFESFIKNSEVWMNNMFEFQQQKSSYNLLDEIEHLDESIKFQEEKLNNEFLQFNYSHWKKIEGICQIESLFKNILSVKQGIDELNTEILSQVTDMPQYTVEIKKSDETETPYLAVNCPQHQNKIIYVNLQKNVKREERLKCINCPRQNSVSVVEFAKQWEQYMSDWQKHMQDFQNPQKKKLHIIKGRLYDFIVDLAKIIKETISVMQNNRCLQIINSKQIQLSFQDQIVRIAEILSQEETRQKIQYQMDIIGKENNINEDCFNKINNFFQYLYETFVSFKFKEIKIYSQQTNVIKNQILSMITYNKISFQMMQLIKQQEDCCAIAFNHDGSIMAAAFYKDIKIWKFENGRLKQTQANLQGHTDAVNCLVYSKSRNWIASGGRNCTIRLWKDMGNNQWSSSEPGKVQTNATLCLLMNRREDQLISGSNDKSIKIWKINYETNQLNYEYSLDKHLSYVYSISLNESETNLVSCSSNKRILIWGKGQNEKWEFKDIINQSVNDFGLRICFINDQIIAWQQYSQGYIHIFELENGKFIEKPELKIELKQVGTDSNCLFPTVFNKQKQLLIQKHNKYVYIIRLQQDGKFKIECDPIDCDSDQNYGALTNDGQHLVNWNDSTKEFKVYRLIYE